MRRRVLVARGLTPGARIEMVAIESSRVESVRTSEGAARPGDRGEP